MISNFGFRINKYIKISLIIGIIDLLIFLIVGKIFNYMEIFNLIISKWKYIWLFVATILICTYFIDVLLFYQRNKKFKFLLIFKEPFKDWEKYINKNINIMSKHKKLDFYSDIYYKVKEEQKIMGIMEDEILIRDTTIHLIFTNIIILLIFFILEKYKFIIYLYCLGTLIIIYVLLNLFYRNYLKYFITEIYTEFLNMNRSKK